MPGSFRDDRFGILFLVLGGVLSPETDLGFWSALSVPYAIARVLLAVFATRVMT
ncbi:MAG TPA: hypothetical protein VJ820_02025 [Propionibacteriaceae bacterium]|jgi:hypothetical protein|nr:hypothetical protein [Propionibacteriaceae bacterium]